MRRFLSVCLVFASLAGITWSGLSVLGQFRRAIMRPELTPVEWVVLVIAATISAHLVLLIHELGHVFGGSLVGYRLRRLVVGPLVILRDGDSTRLGLNGEVRLYGGRVDMERTHASRRRARMAAFILMGPVASVLAGTIILLTGLAWLSEPSAQDMGFAGFLLSRQLAIVGVGSAVVGAANLVPVTILGHPSDGARLLELMSQSAP